MLLIHLWFLPDTKNQRHEETLEALNQEKAKEQLIELKKVKEKREQEADDLKWKSYMKNVIDWCERNHAKRSEKRKEIKVPKRTPIHWAYINVERVLWKAKELDKEKRFSEWRSDIDKNRSDDNRIYDKMKPSVITWNYPSTDRILDKIKEINKN